MAGRRQVAKPKSVGEQDALDGGLGVLGSAG